MPLHSILENQYTKRRDRNYLVLLVTFDKALADAVLFKLTYEGVDDLSEHSLHLCELGDTDKPKYEIRLRFGKLRPTPDKFLRCLYFCDGMKAGWRMKTRTRPEGVDVG